MTRVSAIVCGLCGDLVFSRARHDFRPCTCGAVHIDGGFDYIKVGFTEGSPFKSVHLEIPQDRRQLFDDWNKGDDKYGLIPADKQEGLDLKPVEVKK